MVSTSTDSLNQLGAQKMFAHMDRMAQWQAGELPPPVTVELNLTNLCNHGCDGCSFSYLVNVSKESIPIELAHEIVAQLGSVGARAITFSGGGEPLLYGEVQVLNLMQQAANLGMDVALITNGSLLRNERFLALCKWIRISLDAYDDMTFARFHGRSAKEFEKVVENVRAICAKRVLRGKGATIGVGFLTDQGSIERRDFWKMAEFCTGIPGLDYVQFRPLVQNMIVDPSLTGGYSGFSAGDVQAILEAHAEAAAAFSGTCKILLSEGKYRLLAQENFGRSYKQCLAHFLEATIGADAKVYICCHGQGIEQFCLGDLRVNSFHEIWHGEQARRVYESIKPSAMCPPACRLSAHNQLLTEIGNAVHENFI